MTNPCILRKYNNDNTHSISAGKELFQRLPLLLKGHLKVVRYCYNNNLTCTCYGSWRAQYIFGLK